MSPFSAASTRRGRIVVVGLGPAGPEHMSEAAVTAIDRIRSRFVRTTRHPAASAVRDAHSFDEVYESASSLDAVYAAITDALVEAALAEGEIVYAVPGSPAVAERSVVLLRNDVRVDVEVIPAVSFVDLAWARLGVDPVAAGARLVDGHRFAAEAAGERGPLLVAQCDDRAVLSDIKLAVEDDPGPVTVLQRLGLPDEHVGTVAWDELDRAVEPDHLTTLWIPELAAPVARELVAAVELSRVLRTRCPWDREQTHESLLPFLLEEAYETVEAVQQLHADSGDGYAHLEEELGDLFYQVVFHSTLAAEAGQFTIADVARGIHDKLVRRHPHVFADAEAATTGQVLQSWEELKAAEKGRERVFDGVPSSLPGLLYASKLQTRAAAAGFDWETVEQVYPKVEEELAELRADPSEDEFGDLLFAVVNAGRHLRLDPETSLRRACAKFRTRFEAVERLAAERGLDPTNLGLPALDALWDEIKESNGRP